MNEAYIKKKLKEGLVQFSEHSLHKMDTSDVMSLELIDAMLNSEIIEDYSEDQRGHSCLLLCRDNIGFLHVVLGSKEDNLFIITVYRPSPPKFVDERTRRERE
ncbi:MAG: DUF4258 domain-containing protein [Candidatus Desulfaltia sp.]|nr:DUF4258 domain-containing protein [Candidatus Desulfaltia sp.]